MGLLCLDITPYGIIMGADSRDVLLTERGYKIFGDLQNKNKIIKIQNAVFTGLVGYVGTEKIGTYTTRTWLENFTRKRTPFSLADYCNALAQELSGEWETLNKKSGLWVFIAGFEGKEERFWYVNNSGGIDTETGLYYGIQSAFKAVDDLDQNYIRPGLTNGVTKRKLIRENIFSFRNGVIVPFIQIYDEFGKILKHIFLSKDTGFKKPKSLRDFAFITRQRLEFTKRLYSEKHGIYQKKLAPIGGQVYVYLLGKNGKIFECTKNSIQ